MLDKMAYPNKNKVLHRDLADTLQRQPNPSPEIRGLKRICMWLQRSILFKKTWWYVEYKKRASSIFLWIAAFTQNNYFIIMRKKLSKVDQKLQKIKPLQACSAPITQFRSYVNGNQLRTIVGIWLFTYLLLFHRQ